MIFISEDAFASQAFAVGDFFINYKGREFHKGCFLCCMCNKSHSVICNLKTKTAQELRKLPFKSYL